MYIFLYGKILHDSIPEHCNKCSILGGKAQKFFTFFCNQNVTIKPDIRKKYLFIQVQ